MSVRIEDLYDAALGAGMLTPLWAGAVQAQVSVLQPDAWMGGDLIAVEQTVIEYPASRLILREGDAVDLVQADGSAKPYRVGTVMALADGSEMRAALLPRS